MRGIRFNSHQRRLFLFCLKIKCSKELIIIFNGILCLEKFDCPKGISQQLFSQPLCLPPLQSRWISIQTVLPLTTMDSSSYLNKAQNFTIKGDGLLGRVLIGNANEPICVPGNSALTIPGQTG